MRILHVITTMSRGGAENHLADLAGRQVAVGHEVAIAWLRGDGWWESKLEPLHIGCFPLALRFYGDYRPIVRLRRALASFRPELVHAHMPPAELYARLALVGKRVPFIVTRLNIEPFHRLPLQRATARWTAARAAVVICCSHAVARYVAGPAPGPGLPAKKITVVAYGLDPTPFDAVIGRGAPLRTEWGVRGNSLVVGSVARLAPQKGLDILIEGFARFREISNNDALLVLVGVGPLRAALENLARQRGVAERVLFLGPRTDIPAVIDAFDIFALTSRWEGFGLVLLEAMAARRAIVASRVSAIPEVIGEGDDAAGVLVPPENPEALARAFAELQSAERRQRLGDLGRRRLEREFGAAAMVGATDEAYRVALGRARLA